MVANGFAYGPRRFLAGSFSTKTKVTKKPGMFCQEDASHCL